MGCISFKEKRPFSDHELEVAINILNLRQVTKSNQDIVIFAASQILKHKEYGRGLRLISLINKYTHIRHSLLCNIRSNIESSAYNICLIEEVITNINAHECVISKNLLLSPENEQLIKQVVNDFFLRN